MNEPTGEPVRTPVRILLAEDHRATADLLLGLLKPKFAVVAPVHDGGALTAAAALAPDVIVTDIGLPEVDRLTAGDDLVPGVQSAPCGKRYVSELPHQVRSCRVEHGR